MENTEKKDIFDKIMGLPGLRILEPFYKKNKEVLLYLFFGGLTVVVSVVTYGYFTMGCHMNELVANVISWIIAVLFAFITNRIWVFDKPTDTMGAFLRQLVSFLGGRVLTLLVEEALLFVFITCLDFNSMLVKVVAQVVVIVLNYVFSKWFVFK